jgi:glycosyltransferase involved in cell wall biosynthesis
VIIPTWNSVRTLERCITSVQDQSYKSIEVIVVDGGSSDDSVEVSKRMGCRVFERNGMGMAEATDFGLDMARGKYVYRVDSDVVLDGRIVEEAVTRAEGGSCDAVSILWLPDDSMSFWAKVRRLEKECYKGDFAHSGIRFIRKDVAKSIGGWNRAIVAGEDYDFYNRFRNSNYVACAIDSQETHLGEPLSILDVMRKQYEYGRTLRQFLKANKEHGIVQMNPFRIALLRNWRRFARNPGLTCGFIFYTSMVYIAASIGLVSDSICHKGEETGENPHSERI